VLISLTALGDWMGQTLDTARATQSVAIAEGWLQSATRLDPWPQDAGSTPADLSAWCMELSALTYVNNPRTAISRTTGGVATQWAADAQARREQILAAARARYDTSRAPQGSFPCAEGWPDPAGPRSGRLWP